jgi:uncharacterized membrane protein YczE
VVTEDSVPPPLVMLHVTPAFSVASPVSVAVMASVAAPAMAEGVVGMVTTIGVKVTVTEEVFEVSVLLVAVIVADAVATGVGAVYTPPAVIEPTEALHVTP